MTERALGDWVRQAQGGDLAAFDRLVDRFADSALHVALAVLGDREEAADVAQESLIKAYRRLAELREPERFGAWLRTIARNEAREALRRRTRRAALHRTSEPAALDALAAAPGTDTLEDAEAWEALTADLSDEHRCVLVLRFVSGLSYAEIAETLAISPDLVGVRLLRAKKALRARLEARQ